MIIIMIIFYTNLNNIFVCFKDKLKGQMIKTVTVLGKIVRVAQVLIPSLA